MSRPPVRLLLATVGLLAAGAGTAVAATSDMLGPDQLAAYFDTHDAQPGTTATTVAGATPGTPCGPGSLPETGRQGRVPMADYTSGRAAKGYSCNAQQVSHTGNSGGFRTWRYQDATGHVCAFYDSTTLVGTDVVPKGETGTVVVDMTDPAKPVQTTRLLTAAMESPHESLSLNRRRGLLAAVLGTPATAPGVLDIYDVSKDCRYPVLQSTSFNGRFGHEGGFSPDGKTFYSASAGSQGVTAVDVTDPRNTSMLWTGDYSIHGLSISDDGNRFYGADLGDNPGLTILDVSQIQARASKPQVSVVSHITWPEVSIPQQTAPITIKGRRYLIETDEYERGVAPYNADHPVGAARIIDISDERHPKVTSNLRLAVNQPTARRGDQQDDPGATTGVQGYAGHYCAVPREVDPQLVACSFIASGLRVFNISDPEHPREVAYFNKPQTNLLIPIRSAAFAMSQPSFDVANQTVWYADGNTGFYAVRLANGAWPAGLTAGATASRPATRTPTATPTDAGGTGPTTGTGSGTTTTAGAASPRASAAGTRSLASTGAPSLAGGALLLLVGALVVRRARRSA